jgi:O-antigen/teichoic acid export membrane protein
VATSKAVKVATLVLGHGANAFINFLFLPYLARALPKEEFGSYGQTLFISRIVLSVLFLGLPRIIYVFLAKKELDKAHVFKSNVILCLLAGGAGAVLLFSLSGIIPIIFHNDRLGLLLKVYAPNLLFQMVFYSINAALIYFDKVKQSAIIVSTTNLFRVVALVIAIQILNSLALVFVVLSFLPLLQSVLGWICLPDSLKTRVKIDWQLAKKQLSQGAPLGLANMLGGLLIYVDAFMVSSMFNTKDYAVYRNGAIEIPFIGTICLALFTVLLPEVSRLFSDGKYSEITRIRKRAIIAISAIIYPMVWYAIIFSGPLITLYLSEKYAASAPIFFIYNIVLFLRIADYADVLVASSKNRLLAGIYGFILVISVILNFIFIYLLGYLGAAVATVISYTAFYVILIHISAKILHCQMRSLIDTRKSISFFLIAPILPAIFYILGWKRDNFWIILGYGVVSILGCYLLYLKLKILDIKLLEPVILKIPFIGSRLNHFMLTRIIKDATIA